MMAELETIGQYEYLFRNAVCRRLPVTQWLETNEFIMTSDCALGGVSAFYFGQSRLYESDLWQATNENGHKRVCPIWV